jgi:hypothetical protein
VTAPPLDAVEKEEEISIYDVKETLSWRQLSSPEKLKRSIDNDDGVKNRVFKARSYLPRLYGHPRSL